MDDIKCGKRINCSKDERLDYGFQRFSKIKMQRKIQYNNFKILSKFGLEEK